MLLFIDYQKALTLLSNKLEGWFHAIVLSTPNIVLAALLFALFLATGKMFKGLIRKGLNRVSYNKHVNHIISLFTYYMIIILGVFQCLSILQLHNTVMSLLAGAGIIGLAISFAFQNIASNFISGIIIAFRHPYKVGDWVETNGVYGFVKKVHINYTKLQTENGQEVYVPSKEILEHAVYNFSKLGLREVELHMKVPYKADLDKVMDLVKKAIENVQVRIHDRPLELYYKNFDDWAIDMEITFWIKFTDQRDYDLGCSQAISNIMKNLKSAGIDVAVPERKVELVK